MYRNHQAIHGWAFLQMCVLVWPVTEELQPLKNKIIVTF